MRQRRAPSGLTCSLARDLRSVKSQLLYCDNQRGFQAGQSTSTARGLVLNHTTDEASPHPVLQLILPPEQLPPVRSPPPTRGTPQEMSTRLFAALLAIGMPWQIAKQSTVLCRAVELRLHWTFTAP